MGRGFCKIANVDYCCVLPMNDIVAAIEHIRANT